MDLHAFCSKDNAEIKADDKFLTRYPLFWIPIIIWGQIYVFHPFFFSTRCILSELKMTSRILNYVPDDMYLDVYSITRPDHLTKAGDLCNK